MNRTDKYKMTYDKGLRDIVTSKHLKETKLHNWLVFPHSYSYKLIEILKERWQLSSSDIILDPFCGAGTTLLAAKNCGIAAKGYDISPFAVLITNVKVENYDILILKDCWNKIKREIMSTTIEKNIRNYPELVLKALSSQTISKLEAIEKIIIQYTCSPREKNFFRLGLFAVIPLLSSAQATGGWLKWVQPRKSHSELFSCYNDRIETMLEQVANIPNTHLENCAYEGDARYLPENDNSCSAIITSPPYPNRHDYTRVFGVELMYGFLDWEETRRVRHQSMHSHPEAKPIRPSYAGYTQPDSLKLSLFELNKTYKDKRIIAMLEGYFIDLYCSLKEMARVCSSKGRLALVLGNTQYNGIPVLVDEITAAIGEQLGLRCHEIVAARLRGNSAQQMKIFGKQPSRESIIIFEKI
jgi:DNA modification methylase